MKTFLQKLLNDVLMKYEDIYQGSNILCITKDQYHFEYRNEVNFLKIPSSWELYGSYERDNAINIVFSSLLDHLGPHPNMVHHLKTLNFK